MKNKRIGNITGSKRYLSAVLAGLMLFSCPVCAEENVDDYDLTETRNIVDVNLIIGDTDDDKKVSMNDALQNLKYVLCIDEADTMATFLADYNGNGKLELDDAKQVLETALKIKTEKQAIVLGNGEGVAYICEDEENKLDSSMKWLASREEIVEYIQIYDSEYYKNALLNQLDFIEDNEPPLVLASQIQENSADMESGERGIIVTRVKVCDSEYYDCKVLCNGKNYMFYIIEVGPKENVASKVLSTYRTTMLSPTAEGLVLSSVVVPYGEDIK